MNGAITILSDWLTGGYLVRVSDCPGWTKPEVELPKRHLASGYVDLVLARHPAATVQLIEGNFDDDWRPKLEVVR